MTKQQLELDFNRGRKLRILEGIAKRGVLSSRMLLVLRAIDDTARDQAATTMSLADIGAYAGQSRATAKRGVADLIKHDLVIKTPVLSASGKQANEYQILWPYLQMIADGKSLGNPAPVPADQGDVDSEIPAPDSDYESTQVLKVATGQNQPDPGHHDPSDGSLCTPDPGHCDPSLLYAPSRINNPPTSLGSDWGGLEEILISLGLAAAGRAIQNARDRRCVPDDVARLIDHVRRKPGAYGPGAIFKRISEASPGGDPALGWPAESPDWIRRQKQADQATTRNQAQQEAAQRRADREQKRAADQRLEQELGSVLDGLEFQQIKAFAREHCPPVFEQLKRDPDRWRSGQTRLFLLSALKNHQEDFTPCKAH
jgi:hypothetical protein